MTIRLLVADDHEVVRQGIRRLVADTEIEVVAEAATGQQTLTLAIQTQPDVALVDVIIPGDDVFMVLPRLKAECTGTAIVMFSAHENPVFVARSFAMGAAGYLRKSDSAEVIIRTIRRVASGEDTWTPEELRRVNLTLARPGTNAEVEAPLTNREMEVLSRLADGKTNKQIAQELQISYETVKEHVQHILSKVGVTDRTQAAVWAVRKGLV